MTRKIFGLAIAFSLWILVSCGDNGTSTEQKAHLDVDGWVIQNSAFETVYHVWRGVSSDTLYVPANCTGDHLSIQFLDADSVLVAPSILDDEYKLGWAIADTSVLGPLFRHGEEWEFHPQGRAAGSTRLELQVLHVDHVDARTPGIPVVVSNEIACATDHEDHDDDDHDHDHDDDHDDEDHDHDHE